MKKSETTRRMILQKAFGLIYANGYQKTSIDEILATTSVTKGAFYYHFKTKEEMGMAIINEVMKPALTQNFTKFLREEENPLDAIYSTMHHLLIDEDFLKVAYGCPAGNLVQEMTPWNSLFSDAIREITLLWTESMIAAVTRGQNSGLVRSEVNPKQVVNFILSGYWGIRSLGKLENDSTLYYSYLKELKNYLQSLQ